MLSQAEASNLYQLLECIVPKHYQSFTGSLTLLDAASVNQDDRKLPKQNLHWTIKDIVKACNAFYMHLFWQELHGMQEQGYLQADWQTSVQQLLEGGLLKRLDTGEAFLLRLGRHSGAEALTLNGVRNIMIKGKGNERTPGKQPKTWWLAAEGISDKRNLLPFGWVLVEIDPKSPDVQLQHWLESNNAELTHWMQKQLNKQQTLKQQAEMRQQQEQARKQAEFEQAEQERLNAEAEQARLASLSPLDQEIEAFLKLIQPQDHDTRLLQELEKGRWQDNDAQIVAERIKTLMEQAGKWMPDFAGENKQKVKLKERSLKVLKYL